MSATLPDDEALDLIQALDAYEGEIETLQSSKRDLLTDARERLDSLGATKGDTKVCIAAIKKAVADLRRKRSKPEAAEQADERDALADHYIELCSRVRAPRAAREASETRVSPTVASERASPADPFGKGSATVENGHVDRSASAHPMSFERDEVEAICRGAVEPTAVEASSARLDVAQGSARSGDTGSDVRAVAQASRESASEALPAASSNGAQMHAVEPSPATDTAHESATPAAGNEGTAGCSSPALPSGLVDKSGVTAGERTGALSLSHRAWLAAQPPLKPTDPLFEIRFKARHGRDPLPEERVA